jgi:hypothetical protein
MYSYDELSLVRQVELEGLLRELSRDDGREHNQPR